MCKLNKQGNAEFDFNKLLIYIFIRQKGSSNKWKKHQTHNNKNKQKREKTTLKSGGLVNSVTTFIHQRTLQTSV